MVTPLFCPACRCPECGSDTATGVSGDDFVTCENGHRNAGDVPHGERCPNAHIFDCPNCGARLEPFAHSAPPLRDAAAPYVLSIGVRCPSGCF